MIDMQKITETWNNETKRYMVDEVTTTEECPSGYRYLEFNIYRDRELISTKPTRGAAHDFVKEQGNKAVAQLFENDRPKMMIDAKKIHDTWRKERNRYNVHFDPILDSDGYNRNRGHTCLIYCDSVPQYKCPTDLEAQEYIDMKCAEAVAQLFKSSIKPNFKSAYHQRCSIKPHV